MRRQFSCCLLALLLSTLTAFGATVDKGRSTSLLNFGWRFHYGDEADAKNKDYDDSSWRVIDLPHDFQMEQPWTKSGGGNRGFKPMGTGWYRKTFKADETWKGKRVMIDFGGIMYLGDVWVNGTHVASFEYGYVGMEVDITKLLTYDGDNVIAVRASTGKRGGSRWYTGGGLFRDVHLVVKNKIAVARHGLYVTTPNVSEASADVQVQVEMEGIRNRSFDVDIIAKVYSPDGKLMAERKTKAPKKDKLAHPEVKLPIISVPTPRLWSCESPSLYRAEVTLVSEGKVVDHVEDEFGIRTIEFSPTFGLKLNGKKVFLKGIANHHDLGAVGAAAFDDAIERQFKTMKAFGFNNIRCAHNPYSEGFLKLADKYGILVVDELIDKWSDNSYWGGRKPFTDIWHELITEWVKRDRNHPSVIMWSLGNELQMREDLAGFPTGDWGVTTYRIFDVLVKRWDATRKTTVAMYPSRRGAISRKESAFNKVLLPPELATVTEVSSFNYRYPDYEAYLKAAPHMTVYQSEASTNDLLAPFFGMDHDKMVGLAYWGELRLAGWWIA